MKRMIFLASLMAVCLASCSSAPPIATLYAKGHIIAVLPLSMTV